MQGGSWFETRHSVWLHSPLYFQLRDNVLQQSVVYLANLLGPLPPSAQSKILLQKKLQVAQATGSSSNINGHQLSMLPYTTLILIFVHVLSFTLVFFCT